MSYQRRMQLADAIEAYSEAIIAWDRTALDPHSTQEQIDLTTRLYTTTRTHLFSLVVQATPIPNIMATEEDGPEIISDHRHSTEPASLDCDCFVPDQNALTGPNNTSVKLSHPFLVTVRGKKV